MSVLETFYLLFKSDTTDLDKGVERVTKSIKTLGSDLVRAGAAYIAVRKVLSEVGSAMSYGIQIGQASQALQVNASALDMWGNAVKKTGGTVEGFQSSILSLAEHTGTTVPVALKLLPKLADAFHRMGQMQALKYGKMLGLDTPTILLLQQGRREVDAVLARQKELGTVTQQDAIAFAKFNYELSNTGHGFRSLFLDLLAGALPFIDKVLVAFQDMTIYLRKHSNLIVGALIPISVVLGVIAAEAVIAEWPLYALTAAFLALSAAVALAYDDFKVFQRGGDSVIGDMLKKWPFLGAVIKNVFSGIKAVFQSVKWAVGVLLDDIQAIVDAAHILGGVLEKIWAKFHHTSSKSLEFNMRQGQEVLSNVSLSRIGLQTPASVLNSSRQNVNSIGIQSITINTQATDAKGISAGLTTELQRQLNQAYNTASDGRLA